MIGNLMFQAADWYRPPVEVDTTATEYLGTDGLVAQGVPVSIQPASAKQIEFYSAFRSLEITHAVFTENPGPWKRNDVLVYAGRRFQVQGVRNLIELNRVYVLDCLEYSGADGRR